MDGWIDGRNSRQAAIEIHEKSARQSEIYIHVDRQRQTDKIALIVKKYKMYEKTVYGRVNAS